MSLNILKATLLGLAVAISSAALATPCEQGTPSVSVSLTPTPPDADGFVPATVTFSFPRPHWDYGQRVELYIDGQGGVIRYSADTGSLDTVLDLSCSLGTRIITVRAISQDGCVAESGTGISLNSTPSGGLSVAVNDDGVVTPTISYEFPYTRDDNYSVQQARVWLYRPDGSAIIADSPLYWLSDDNDTVVYPPVSLACSPSGTYRFHLSLRGCTWVDSDTSFLFDSTPQVSVQVANAGGTLRRADITYLFPRSPNVNYDVGRRLRITVRDSAGQERLSQVLGSLYTREGTRQVTFDTSCWPSGTATVQVEAYGCGGSAVGTTSLGVDESTNTTIALLNHNGILTADYTWAFSGQPGSVRVDQVQPDGSSIVIVPSFVPTMSSGAAEVTLSGPPTQTVTVRSTVTNAAGCVTATDVAAHQGCVTDCTSAPKVGQPVDVFDGNMRYDDADPLPVTGGFRRAFDSRHAWQGRFGIGWTSLLDAAAKAHLTNSVLVTTSNNEPYVFDKVGAVYVQRWPKGVTPSSLTASLGSGTYTFRHAGSSQRWIFSNTSGRLIEVRDEANGRSILVSYDAGGNPRALADSWGNWSLTITTTSGRVSTVAVDGFPGTIWEYTYDSGGHLLTVTGPAGPWRRYDYSSGGFLTNAWDGEDHLLESHQYDSFGRATTSTGHPDPVTSIEYDAAGTTQDELVTRVTKGSGAVTTYRARAHAGTWRAIEIAGGCTTCGSGDRTHVYDSSGRIVRTQDATGYITVRAFDANHRVVSETTPLRPSACDPESDSSRCRMSSTALAAAVLSSTPQTTGTTYVYGSAEWPERSTLRTTPSVLATGQVRTSATEYRAGSGAVGSTSITGYTDASTQETRTTVYAYYGDTTNEPAFDPGSPFQSAWLALPQPSRLLRSIDGPRTDVEDHSLFVYYPVDAGVPALLRGHLAAVRNALGHTTRYETYDVFGNVTRMVDANGVATERGYDALGRLLTTTTKGVAGCDATADPLCATDLTASRVYGPATATSEQTPSGSVTVHTYDSLGRLESSSRGPAAGDLRERTELTYDTATGKKNRQRLLARENGAWVVKRWEEFTYDAEARLSDTVHAGGAFTRNAYDEAGRLESVRDERHTQPNTFYAYDAAGRLATVTQQLSTAPSGTIVTTYGYDLHGNLTSVTDPKGDVTTYLYDDFGQMLRQVSPVTGTTTYAYDPAGNLVETVDANNVTTTRTYDALGRAVTATFAAPAETETVSWTFDDPTSGNYGIGRLATMSSDDSSTSHAYDRRGLLIRESVNTFGTPFEQRYGYDANGNRTRVVYPSGRIVNYTLDYAGRPITATGVINGVTTPYITGASYLPYGPLIGQVFGNGVVESRTFDARYRPATVTLGPVNAPLASYEYASDESGNVLSIDDATDHGFDRSFGYDDLNRLITANTGSSLWGTGSYTYDVNGNILSSTLGAKSRSFTIDPGSSRIATATAGAATTSIEYDAAGNELNGPVADQTENTDVRVYSVRNLLRKVQTQVRYCAGYNARRACAVWRYTTATLWNGYDARGVRVGALNSNPAPDPNCPAVNGCPSLATTDLFFYTPELTLLAISGFSSTRDIVWFNGTPVASEIGGVDGMDTDRRFMFTDHLSTPVLEFDEAGTVTWRAEYEPYGNVYSMRAGAPSEQPLRFPGQQVAFTNLAGDEENYNIFRWYRSGWGRYSQADQIGLRGGNNLYMYARNNPTDLIDPLGAYPVQYIGLPNEAIEKKFGPGTLGGTTPHVVSKCSCKCSGGKYKALAYLAVDPISVYFSTDCFDANQIILQEEKHVAVYQNGIDTANKMGVALMKKSFDTKGDCEKACSGWLIAVDESITSAWKNGLIEWTHPDKKCNGSLKW